MKTMKLLSLEIIRFLMMVRTQSALHVNSLLWLEEWPLIECCDSEQLLRSTDTGPTHL